MKSKKKIINEAVNKYEVRNQRKQSQIVKKSPVKVKSTQNQASFLSSLDNNSFNPYKNLNSFYGKKHYGNDLSQKKDSNQSSTHCSINNRSHKDKSVEYKRKVRRTKKNFQQLMKTNQDDNWQRSQISLNQNQVMTLINNYAMKIQRQWRRYWFRKCLSFIILKSKQRKKFRELNECYETQYKKQQKKALTRFSYNFEDRIIESKQGQMDRKRRSLPRLNSKKVINEVQMKNSESDEGVMKDNMSSVENQVTEQFFNSKKYGSVLSFPSMSKQDNFRQAHERTSSLDQRIANEQKQPVQTVEIGLNCSIQQTKQFNQSLTTPMAKIRDSESNKKFAEKKVNIRLEPKVYQLQLAQTTKPLSLQNKVVQPPSSSKSLQGLKILKRSSPRNEITSIESIKSNYDIKYPSSNTLQKDPFGMSKIFKKCKKQIQKQVSKKIQTISKHYQQKQITERTYKNLINQTQEKLRSEMKSLEIKEGNIKNSWREVYNMFKEYVKQNSFQHPQNNHTSQEFNCFDGQQQHQISFDKWDFQSSAKKSLSQLQSFQEFARQLNERNPQKLKGFYFQAKRLNNDQKSIQKVLDQLQKLESPQSNRRSQCSLRQEESAISILQEFRQRQRPTSFQKKSQHMMVQNVQIPFQKEIKSEDSLRNFQREMNRNQQSEKRENINDFQRQNFQKIQISDIKRDEQQQQVKTPARRSRSSVEAKFDKMAHPPKLRQHIKTQQSQEESQVQIRVSSMKASRQLSLVVDKKQMSQNHNIIKQQEQQNESQLRKRLQLQQQSRQEHIKRSKLQSQRLIQSLIISYFNHNIRDYKSVIIHQLPRILSQVYIQSKRRKQFKLNELKKYPPTIQPQIDAINNWLLEISHHLLDNHNAQIKRNLLTIRQLTKQQMLQIVKSKELSSTFFHSHPYITISEKIFKQFEFFYIKNVANGLQIEEIHQQNFQHLIYAFHRCLIDCMNLTLLDELSIGRNWVVVPWRNKFRYRKNQVYEHSKQCLERAINRVSGWAEYNLAQLVENEQISVQQWRQYQQQKINLVIRQQVLEYSFENEFMESHLILRLSELIYNDQIKRVVEQIQLVFVK